MGTCLLTLHSGQINVKKRKTAFWCKLLIFEKFSKVWPYVYWPCTVVSMIVRRKNFYFGHLFFIFEKFFKVWLYAYWPCTVVGLTAKMKNNFFAPILNFWEIFEKWPYVYWSCTVVSKAVKSKTFIFGSFLIFGQFSKSDLISTGFTQWSEIWLRVEHILSIIFWYNFDNNITRTTFIH